MHYDQDSENDGFDLLNFSVNHVVLFGQRLGQLDLMVV